MYVVCSNGRVYPRVRREEVMSRVRVQRPRAETPVRDRKETKLSSCPLPGTVGLLRLNHLSEV